MKPEAHRRGEERCYELAELGVKWGRAEGCQEQPLQGSLRQVGEDKSSEGTVKPPRTEHGRGRPVENSEPFDRKSPQVSANSNPETLTNPTLASGHGITVWRVSDGVRKDETMKSAQIRASGLPPPAVSALPVLGAQPREGGATQKGTLGGTDARKR